MTAGQLIDILKKCDPNVIVILQKDAEGNGYSPLAGTDSDVTYGATSTYSGDVYSLDESDEDVVPCVVLYPVN